MSESGQAQAGQLLAQAREEQKLSLRQVANELKLSVSFVKAIEAEQCSSLPDVAFVRGYVRNYARLLGFSKEQTQQVVMHFESIMAPAKDNAQGVPLLAPKTKSPRWWRLLWLIAVVAVVSQVFFMWQGSIRSSGEYTHLPEAETVVSMERAQEAGHDAEAREAIVKGSIEDQEESIVDLEAEATEEDASLLAQPQEEFEEVAAEDAVAKEAPAANIVLTFTNECWVNVVDSRDRTLFSGIKQSGESLFLDGQAPYRFTFGDGAALQRMQINGKEVALPARRAGQVWRYTSEN